MAFLSVEEFYPGGHQFMSGDILVFLVLEGQSAVAFRGQRTRALLSTPQCTGEAPARNEFSSPEC